jgi:hypothetical protein
VKDAGKLLAASGTLWSMVQYSFARQRKQGDHPSRHDPPRREQQAQVTEARSKGQIRLATVVVREDDESSIHDVLQVKECDAIYCITFYK